MLNDVIVQRICDAVDSSFDDQLRFTQDLIAYPSQRGQEHTAQEFVYDAMRELGLSVDRWKIDVEEIRNHVGFSPVTIPYENAINVVGIRRPRQTEGRSLILINRLRTELNPSHTYFHAENSELKRPKA